MMMKTFGNVLLTAVLMVMFALGTAYGQPQQLRAANEVLQNGESIVSTIARAEAVGKSLVDMASRKKTKTRKADQSNAGSESANKNERLKLSSPVPTADLSDFDIQRAARLQKRQRQQQGSISTGFNTSGLADEEDDDDLAPIENDENEVRRLNRQTRPRRYVKIE